ncbi:uncharacterized, partial [Tachysurus ichikawai]
DVMSTFSSPRRLFETLFPCERRGRWFVTFRFIRAEKGDSREKRAVLRDGLAVRARLESASLRLRRGRKHRYSLEIRSEPTFKDSSSPALTLIKACAAKPCYQSAVSAELFVIPVLLYFSSTSISTTSGGSSDLAHVPLSALPLEQGSGPGDGTRAVPKWLHEE